MDFTKQEVLSVLDVAILAPISTIGQIEALAQEAIEVGYGFVGIHGWHVKPAYRILKGTNHPIVACIDFPYGISPSFIKAAATEQAMADGAGEIDMVLNLSAFMSGDLKYCEEDIRCVVDAAGGHVVKVIIETPFLNPAQKVLAAKITMAGGAHFVKTCSGTSILPVALYEDVRLIRETVGPQMGVKASSWIHTYLRFTSMMEAGANRIGLGLEEARAVIAGWEEAHR